MILMEKSVIATTGLQKLQTRVVERLPLVTLLIHTGWH